MSCIITSDIHFNDKPQDEYRWGLIDWLLKQEKADELIICGDLADAKDRHAAKLVNRFHNSIRRLAARYKVILLKGNHDYIEPSTPFFEFVGDQENIRFIKEPTVLNLSVGKATFVPAGVKWNFKLHETPLLFTHATFNGAKAENGQQLTGVDPHVLDHWDGFCYSGDVHVPQTMLKGKITYIGAPYHTKFGDSFKSRIIRLDKNGEMDLHFPAPQKLTFHISRPEDLKEEKAAAKGDHVKVKCYLRRAEYIEWQQYKREIRDIAEERDWMFFGAEPVPLEIAKKETDDKQTDYMRPDQLLSDYAKQKKAGEEHIKIGKELLI